MCHSLTLLLSLHNRVLLLQVSVGSGRKIERNVYSTHQSLFLQHALSWLVINSMRVDGIQFDLLCEQNVCNVWRKRAFASLCREYTAMDSTNISSQLIASLQVFRERVDFVIENSVPETLKYSQKIVQLMDTNRLVRLGRSV